MASFRLLYSRFLSIFTDTTFGRDVSREIAEKIMINTEKYVRQFMRIVLNYVYGMFRFEIA
jgi:hypothetical protein